jgi:hypothetical protein
MQLGMMRHSPPETTNYWLLSGNGFPDNISFLAIIHAILENEKKNKVGNLSKFCPTVEKSLLREDTGAYADYACEELEASCRSVVLSAGRPALKMLSFRRQPSSARGAAFVWPT